MTRKEKLDWLYRLRSEIYVYMPKKWLIPMNNALDMAIEALEQEQDMTIAYLMGKYEDKEPCDDAVSREAVLDEAFEVDTKEYGRIDVVGVDAIDALPSVTPKQKSGHWEWVQYDSSPNIGNWRCSECRAIIPHTPKETDNTPIYKLCPMCGAKMVDPQESEEV